ncbi:SHOCT domain-containing protein [Actinomadura madurae]|uniref:SHOCT domain-containing protein n=2 Tax=Actinomadura madurae TaxID=1993 RepID=UPI002027339D|nr:SHOCT domain-containing protein [Actinomadura madurae]MCP9948999.1 SHOCT domain-containing protein [Actinomadura madurae]MCP9965771.1 SHOCT domain-containing protein [Actinomadura madurae]MCP9978247.1 SHOCT domain-containing protein [Actinomadura madurae]MCQ0010236.1 SHOCT domain-containing protein [Actinomadura madurae]MCQ0014451.1 SHOCT domain-containing protein [Actinomadura madurae]
MNIGYVFVAADPGDGWGHMGGDGWSGWMWLWGTLMMLLWIAVIGAAAWLIVRVAASHRASPPRPHETGLERARGILAERYARGEISTEEYDERLAKLH